MDAKQLKALSVLGWNFGLHLLRAMVPGKKEDQVEKFRGYFRPDRIAGFTAYEHRAILTFENCTVCGICSSHCRVMAGSAGKFLGPEHLAVSASRSQPDFAADASSLFLCAVCGQCEPDCPENVPVSRMVMHMRNMIRRVSPEAMPQAISTAAANLARHGNPFGPAPEPALPRRADAEFILYLGCRERMQPERVAPRLALLDRLGVKVTGVTETCCGGVPAGLGLENAGNLRETLLSAGPKKILTLCPHCTETFRTDQALTGKIEVRHLIEVLAERLPSGATAKALSAPVAFHDPCHLARGCGLTQEPRQVLLGLGLPVVEMEESGDRAPCCGAGGGLALVDPGLGKTVARSRLIEARQAGAKTLVTACSGCRDQLNSARQDGDPPVLMIEEILFD